MTKREILSLASKVIGVFIFGMNLMYITFMLGMYNSYERLNLDIVVVALLCETVMIVLIFYLVFRSDRIAAWLYPREEKAKKAIRWNKQDVYELCIVLLGLWFAIQAIGQVAWIIYNAAAIPGLEDAGYQARAWGGIITPTVKLLLGLFMMLRSKKIVRFVDRYQK